MPIVFSTSYERSAFVEFIEEMSVAGSTAKFIFSQLRKTGTTNPVGEATATEISV
jgi:hypothetical protein